MIIYTSGGIWYIAKIFQMRGSVFPNALLVALPCAVVAAVMRFLATEGTWSFMADETSVIKETQAWGGFTFLVGFLIVFRTSQAYNRFWDGCTSTHQMRAEWFDSCSSLFAFCQYAKVRDCPNEKIATFKHTLVRLFSMLHASCLAELEEINIDTENLDSVQAFGFELIDPMSIDSHSLSSLKASNSRVELCLSWIQCLIVENISSGPLSIPPPILSRAFNEIANGMVAFHDAIKITYIPFPFPYAQTCDCLLLMHWFIVPFVTCHWVTSPWWAATFVFIQVFILWCLNFIAVEIENPFGTDANDLDGRTMQSEFNRQLLLLLQSETCNVPQLHLEDEWVHGEIGQFDTEKYKSLSFRDVWEVVDENKVAWTARKDHTFTRAHIAEPSHNHNIRASQHPRSAATSARQSIATAVRISVQSAGSTQSMRSDNTDYAKDRMVRQSSRNSDASKRPSFLAASREETSQADDVEQFTGNGTWEDVPQQQLLTVIPNAAPPPGSRDRDSPPSPPGQAPQVYTSERRAPPTQPEPLQLQDHDRLEDPILTPSR